MAMKAFTKPFASYSDFYGISVTVNTLYTDDSPNQTDTIRRLEFPN